MDLWFWALLLLVFALTMGILEMFVPSGGILTFLSIAGLVAGIVVAFMHGPWFGVGYFVVIIAGTPVAIYLAIQLWPKTPIGRRIMLEQAPPVSAADLPGYQGLKELLGRRGTAKTKMLPAGAVVIDGRTYDAFSEGMAIQPDTPIVVVRVTGAHITVRPWDGEDEPMAAMSPDEAIERSYDVIDIEDPFADVSEPERGGRSETTS